MGNRKVRTIVFTIVVVLSIIVQVGSQMVNPGLLNRLNIGQAEVAVNSMRGVLQAVISLLCVLMVCIDYKKGRYFTFAIQGVSILSMIGAIARMRQMAPLPGLVNTILSVVTVYIISVQIEKIQQKRITDDITGLYNREGFLEATEKIVEKDKTEYVVFIEIRNFKDTCDNIGHEYAEYIHKIISSRMKDIVEANGIVCRLDSIEYAVLLKEHVDPVVTTEKLVDCISKCISLDKEGVSVNCYLSAYAGVVCYPTDAKDVDTLMKYADVAMYHALQEKKHVVRFDDTIVQKLLRQVELERIINDGLENEYFSLVYQPQFSLADKKIRGVETLLRLKLPDGRSFDPEEFIPIAEKSDLILRIDDYVLQRAMKEFKSCMEYRGVRYLLSVNVSAKSMASKDFVSKVKQFADKIGFRLSNLEIEITEYSFAESREQTSTNVEELRSLGIKIALDDFGTGYTSLSQLLHLPINLLKIDKSLIDNIEQVQLNKDFVDSVIYMGHLMGCEVMSEGVETEGQMQILREQKCDYIQGYFWSKPLRYYDAVRLLFEIENA